ncbi:hypothetical protein [Saccharothrix sp. NRRL B-16348]|uniref:hypothetical protein n=1 Tax=Saccharothrix sp. NRRL B-16348 TaxID=1415542 RepID=UPI000B31CBE7
MREWLDALAPVDLTVSAIVFDTRVKVGWVPGSAAKAITRRLRRLRFTVGRAPVSFYVGSTPGPLLDGETDRATAWARTIRTTSVLRLKFVDEL